MWFSKRSIDEVNASLSRDELLRRSRLLVVDDERPDIVDDLKKARFSVDYESDITRDNMHIIESSYDLILLDYGNVGKSFGSDEGLSLLKYIKRINPSVVVIAYTSKALNSDQSDFFRLSNGVLNKDAGISESLEIIEDGLKEALSTQNLWRGLLTISGIKPGSDQDKQWQDLFVKGLEKKDKLHELKNLISKNTSIEGATKIGLVIFEKLVELGVSSLLGG